MLYHAKNGRVAVNGTTMDYICFGSGNRTLIMIPGLGDGLMTVKGKALPFALMYRMYAKAYRVYVFSRGSALPADCTTQSMAEELFAAMQQLDIQTADVVGISQGGLIAQHLAADHPEAVHRLVLVVTAASAGETIRSCVSAWMDMAKRDAYTELMRDNLYKMYTAAYLKKNAWMLPAAGKFGKPKSYDRFLAMANACMTHDAQDRLEKILAPTLVIGGGEDRVIGSEAATVLANGIPNAKLHVYPNLGHALYEEAKDFNDLVLSFLEDTKA